MKPEDIPQGVWDAAHAVNLDQLWALIENDTDDIKLYQDTACIARAIMVATLAEREACALVLDGAADRQREAWDEYITSGGKGPATSFESIFRGQADAIRKRGET